MGLRNRGKKSNPSNSKLMKHQHILEQFRTEWNRPKEDAPRFITNIYGVEGAGKSSLLKLFLLEHGAKDMFCRLDAGFESFLTPVDVVRAITLKTSKGGKPVKFVETHKFLTKYTDLINQPLSNGFHLPGMLVNNANDGGAPDDQTTRRLHGLRQVQKRVKQRYREFRHSPITKITAKLVEEINTICEPDGKFLLAIDSFDRLTNDVEKWLIDILLGQFADHINVDFRLFVVSKAAVKERNPEWHHSWGDFTFNVELESLTRRETKIYLDQKEAKVEDKHLNVIHTHTRGLPIWLNVWVNSELKAGSFFIGDTVKTADELFMEMMAEPEHLEWLLRASLLRRFNRRSLGVLLENDGPTALNWLGRQSSMTEQYMGYWKIHGLARKTIVQDFYVHSKHQFARLIEKIILYFESQLSSPWYEWKDLGSAFELKPTDLLTVADISYYRTLKEGLVTERAVDMALRVADIRIDAVNLILNGMATALRDIRKKLPPKLRFLILFFLKIRGTTRTSSVMELERNVVGQPFSQYQKAVLLLRLAVYYLYHLENEERAEFCLEEALKLYPNYKQAQIHLARLQMHRNTEKTHELLRDLLAEDPRNIEGLFLQAGSFALAGEYNRAIDSLSRILKGDPSNALAQFNWGMILMKTGKADEALEKIKLAGKMDVEFEEAVEYVLSRKDQPIEEENEAAVKGARPNLAEATPIDKSLLFTDDENSASPVTASPVGGSRRKRTGWKDRVAPEDRSSRAAASDDKSIHDGAFTDKSIHDGTVIDKSIHDATVINKQFQESMEKRSSKMRPNNSDHSIYDGTVHDPNSHDMAASDHSIYDGTVHDPNSHDMAAEDHSIFDGTVQDQQPLDLGPSDRSIYDGTVGDPNSRDNSRDDRSIYDGTLADMKPPEDNNAPEHSIFDATVPDRLYKDVPFQLDSNATEENDNPFDFDDDDDITIPTAPIKPPKAEPEDLSIKPPVQDDISNGSSDDVGLSDDFPVFDMGVELTEQGRHEEALEHYQDAYRRNPNNGVAYDKWALSLIELGRHEEALEKFAKALEVNPENPSTYFYWAISLAKAGHHEASLEKYRQAAKLQPSNSAIFLNWGISLAELGQTKEAMALFQSAEKLDPKNKAVTLYRGIAFTKSGRYPAAIKQFESARIEAEKNSNALLHWGMSLAGMKQHKEAIERYQRIVKKDPQNMQAHLHSGISLTKLKKPKFAIEKLGVALEINPKHAPIYYYWGLNLVRMDAFDSAIEKYQKAIELDPQYANAYLAWGNALASNDGHDEAITVFQKALEMDPKLGSAYQSWGMSLIKKEDYKTALKKLKRAIELDPKSAKPYFYFGVALTHLNKSEQALKYFARSCRRNPRFIKAFYQWGLTLARLEQHEEATARYLEAAKLNPNHKDVYYDWAKSLMALKQYEEAGKKLEKAASLRPESLEIVMDLGICLFHLKKYEEAAEQFHVASQTEPRDPVALGHLAKCLIALKRFTEAEAIYESYDSSAKERGFLHYRWGLALSDEGKIDDAIEQFTTATEIDPNLTAAYNNWGNRLADLGYYEEAIHLYKKVLSISPKNATAYNNWGNRLADLGKYEEAIEKYEMATKVNPRNASAFFNWGNCLADLNRYEEATTRFENALMLDPTNSYYWAGIGWHYFEDLRNYPKAIEATKKALELDGGAIWIRSNLAVIMLHYGQPDIARREYTDILQSIISENYVDPEYGDDKVRLIHDEILNDLRKLNMNSEGEVREKISEIISMIERVMATL